MVLNIQTIKRNTPVFRQLLAHAPDVAQAPDHTGIELRDEFAAAEGAVQVLALRGGVRLERVELPLEAARLPLQKVLVQGRHGLLELQQQLTATAMSTNAR